MQKWISLVRELTVTINNQPELLDSAIVSNLHQTKVMPVALLIFRNVDC
jgi:hypothetical protein